MPNPKPKRKKLCKGCREYYRPKESDPKFKDWCSDKCGLTIATKNFNRMKRKAKKESDNEHKKRKREFYKNDIKTRREAAVYWFNRFIRLRDAGSPCISCGNDNPNIKYDAGHFIPAGSCSALRFDERNVNLQCSLRCNVHLSGNRLGYRDGLVRKIGEVAVSDLEKAQPIIKITASWYQEIEDKYKAKCKAIEELNNEEQV